jgi:hypothetical protein
LDYTVGRRENFLPRPLLSNTPWFHIATFLTVVGIAGTWFLTRIQCREVSGC